MRFYLTDKRAIAYYCQSATPSFWDQHWQTEDLQKYIKSSTRNGLFIQKVKEYLPTGSIVLEGGCGRGQLVHALHYQGYQAIGIDFAPEIIDRINEILPELDVRLGDVRNLPLESASLDGYISLGVIEHFWDGYEPIINEMARTIKSGGYLFVSFPHMSILRQIKAKLGVYPTSTFDEMEQQRQSFYQFALTAENVISDLELSGFTFCESNAYGGIKGFKDEVTWVKPWLQELHDGKKHQYLKKRLNRLLLLFSSHSTLLIFQKSGS